MPVLNKKNITFLNRTLLVLSFLSASFLFSCKKYLEEKPVKTDVIPSSLNDLQAVLDRYDFMNLRGPILLEALTDNYYLTTANWNTRPPDDKLNYVWDKNAQYNRNWSDTYSGPIYYANVVLDQLSNIKFKETERQTYNNIKGSALFYRAFAFYELAQLYCRPYSSTASSDLGIVLRLTSNINTPSVRSTVQETYDEIINDFKESLNLLGTTSLYPTRPNKTASYGALARTYLSMRDYANAGKYSDSALQNYNTLMDYNKLIPVGNPPFKTFNPEVIFHNRQTYNSNLLNNTIAKIDSNLYKSYDPNDLRQILFFKKNTGVNAGTYGFQGSYEGATIVYASFDGIVTDELYLIRAECSARAGNKDSAINDLNTLLKTRWKTGSFIPFMAATANDALSIILIERRKELVYRGLRWTDLRRLNLEGYNITLTRIENNASYQLPPNDLRWVLLIPPDILKLANIPQNPRQ